ncbi:MAG: ribose 5-phosphate isomerase B [Chloroflexi bacterium]|nr:ribose 5-phosphate isomerase B [Chloroflexota bacterium]
MKVALGADHAGFPLKEELKETLKRNGIEYVDFGTFSNESVDYPDFAGMVAEKVVAGEFDKGVLVCGSGIGVSIAANKVPGARAALCSEIETARLSRRHNDANVLTLGARFIDVELAKKILLVWLETEFEGGRHGRRVDKIRELERRYCGSDES